MDPPSPQPNHHHLPPCAASTTTLLHSRTLKPNPKMTLLALNYISLFVGSLASTLLLKYYFIHNGSSRWVTTWVQSAGFPLLLLLVYLPYALKITSRPPFSTLTKKGVFLGLVMGLFLGVNNLLFSWGSSYLPVSTNSLLLSTQLAFTLLLSWLIVKQKINFNNVNCVVLLTLSSILLALDSGKDKSEKLSRGKYFIGFFSTIGAGLLFALYLPLMEMIYREVDRYETVVEMQLIMEAAATVLATVGMAADSGFQQMKRESDTLFDKGPTVYWLTVTGNLVCWQFAFMGTAGMVYLTTGLTGGICMTALLAMNVVSGVAVYGDRFDGAKAVSTVLCTWGFLSYVYGMHVKKKKEKEKEKENRGMEMSHVVMDDNP